MKSTTWLCGPLAGALLGAASLAQGAQPQTPAAPSQAAPAPGKAKPMPKPVEINSASRQELMKLPGINAALADKIIAGRPYLSKSKLVTQNVIPAMTYQAIRGRIYCRAHLPAKP
jgi:DNA uptake protein ComE-like DNA-binding protein